MQTNRIVSDSSEELIVVDSRDQPIGRLTKAQCHAGNGVLHRAFSIHLINDRGEVLLQKRAEGKPLWPLYWSNSCCSHPLYGEAMGAALQRRLWQELGLRCPLRYLYKFQYRALFEDVGAEHEICSVFLGRYPGGVRPNRTEIADLRFFPPDEVDELVANETAKVTPWFRMEWNEIRERFAGLLNAARSEAGL